MTMLQTCLRKFRFRSKIYGHITWKVKRLTDYPNFHYRYPNLILVFDAALSLYPIYCLISAKNLYALENRKTNKKLRWLHSQSFLYSSAGIKIALETFYLEPGMSLYFFD